MKISWRQARIPSTSCAISSAAGAPTPGPIAGDEDPVVDDARLRLTFPPFHGAVPAEMARIGRLVEITIGRRDDPHRQWTARAGLLHGIDIGKQKSMAATNGPHGLRGRRFTRLTDGRASGFQFSQPDLWLASLADQRFARFTA